MWSAGAVLYTMLSGRQPFDNEKYLYKKYSFCELMRTITKGIYDMELEPFKSVSDEAKDLIRKLMEIDPKQRLSAKEALNHPWII